MAEYFALTRTPLPAGMHGADGEYSIRTLSARERGAIEDYFSSKELKVSLNPKTTAVIVPQSQASPVSIEDFAILVEFALGILAISGFQPITTVAIFTGLTCSEAVQRTYPELLAPPRFPKKLVKTAASTWLRYFFVARKKTKDRLHITADRFVRYLTTNNSRDALVDLCICLESLIESQTEISFRFSMCLSKATGLKNAEDISELLADLYDLRSKVVHGADFTKEHGKVASSLDDLRKVARTILTAYVLYLTEHTKEEWKKHLKAALFN